MRRCLFLLILIIACLCVGHHALLALDVPAPVQEALEQWAAHKRDIQSLVEKNQYQQAISLCEDFYNEDVRPLLSLSPKAAGKDRNITKKIVERLVDEIFIYIKDLKGIQELFQQMIDQLNSGGKRISIDTAQVLVKKADEDGIEGEIAGLQGSAYKKSWSDMSARTLYGLFPAKLPKESLPFKAVFCYTHKLLGEADQLLIDYYDKCPYEKDQIDEILNRYHPELKGTLPLEGFTVYQRRWITPDDKYHLERGDVRDGENWITSDEAMIKKGYVKFEGRWITAQEKERILNRQKKLEALKTLFAPKGIINRPGADRESLGWDKARTKETEHYVIKTNLSEDALNDIAYVAECLYTEFKKIFKISKDIPLKLDVLVCRTREEYIANGGPPGAKGVFMVDSSKFPSGRILTYYYIGEDANTTFVLLHEGTHQFVHHYLGGVQMRCPLWINEGLATYYETSKFDGTELKTNIANRLRFPTIQQNINENKYIRLREFINIKQDKYNNDCYAQGWSLAYFFFNFREGAYADELEKYLAYFKRGVQPTPDEHIKLFEQAFNEKIEVIEGQWKSYIRQGRFK